MKYLYKIKDISLQKYVDICWRNCSSL